MEPYINKDALVAEIERLDEFYHHSKSAGGQAFIESLLSFINTLETKEIDLEKEATEFVQTKEFVESKESPILLIAKHFFELGLNAQRKISYVPNIDDSLKELGVDPSSKEAKIFKESYYMALENFKAQKEE